MSDVFISYKAEELDEASWVKRTLENNGISCWMAPNSIPGGSSYAVEIPQAIRECKVFVLILSKQAQESKWVPREIDQAINYNKTIMPFMLENCSLQDDFNFYLTNVQRYAAYESKSAAIKKMINEIRAVLGMPPIAEEDETAAPKTETSETAETVVPAVPEETKAEPAQETLPEADKGKEEKPKAAKEKAAKKPKSKEGKTKTAKKPVKTLYWILLAAAVLLALVAVIFGKVFSKKPDPSAKYDKDAYTIEIDAKTLTNDDLQELSVLENISTLKITNSDISKLDFSLLQCENLWSLYIENSNLTDEQMQAIDWSEIRDVSVANNAISNLSSVKFSESLYSLNVSGNKIADLSSLSVYTDLETLNVSGCGLTSLAGLETCIELKEVYASDNELKDLTGLDNTTLLQKVNISGNQISDLSLLDKSSATLKMLFANDNALTTLSGIKNCALITDLSVNNNKLTGLDDLSSMSQIVNFSAKKNQLSSLKGLESNTGLRYFNVADNVIEDVSALASIQSEADYPEVTMILSHNKIATLSLPNVGYRVLAIQGNPITDYSSVSALWGYDFVFDYHSTLAFDKLKENVSHCYIIGCPLDKQVSVKEALGSYNTHFVTEDDLSDVMGSNVPYAWE